MIALLLCASQYALNLLPAMDGEGYSGWLFFAFLVGRVLGIEHPEVLDGRALTTPKKILGWIAIVIFILCFTPQPFMIS